MAKSKFEYVKDFEQHIRCLPNTWILVRVDGKGFHKFADKHGYSKPNDLRGLSLMTTAAQGVMREFVDVVLGFGHSDEYSFLFKRDTDLYSRRVEKILSSVCSTFTSYFVFNWTKHFGAERPLLYPPVFDARVVLYPTDQNIRDYFSWRQADVHINNLYNTCFWNLVQEKKLSNKEAEEALKGTVSSDKNELLFSEFGINYNNEPEVFRKGTTLMRKKVKKKTEIVEFHGDIIGDTFWTENPHILNIEERPMSVKPLVRENKIKSKPL